MRGPFSYTAELVTFVNKQNYVRYKTQIFVNGALVATTDESAISEIQRHYVKNELPRLKAKWKRREL